jgi:hypothetical protein
VLESADAVLALLPEVVPVAELEGFATLGETPIWLSACSTS